MAVSLSRGQGRNDEIEKKTNEVDKLNRAYEKLTANMEDEDTGPLEGTIKNLKREINQKTVEGTAPAEAVARAGPGSRADGPGGGGQGPLTRYPSG